MKVYGDMTRRLMATVVFLGLTCGLSGCLRLHKRPTIPALPPVVTPLELDTAPPVLNPPMLTSPVVDLPPIPISSAVASPRRERRHLAQKATATPAEEVTPQPMTDETAIGDLTAGGAANPQALHDAADFIASIEKRLNGLPPPTVRRQRSQVNRVRNFWRQAHEALNSGDVEGATTLATKAKLLLDDLEKPGGGE